MLDLHGESGHNACDVFAVSSIVTNSTDLDKSKGKCLGLQELREFLEDNQECCVSEEDLVDIILVSGEIRER